MTTAPPIVADTTPSPFDAPVLWQTVILTLPDGSEVRLPPDPKEGTAIVSFATKVDADAKQSTGQGTTDAGKPPPKAETTIKKIEPSKGEIDLQWSSRVDPQMRALLRKIHPNGPFAGKPLDVMNPQCDEDRVHKITIVDWGKVTREGQLAKLKIQVWEWNPPPPAAPGDGADTATAEEAKPAWSPSYGNTGTTYAGWSGSFGGSKGFGGSNAPQAKP
jgi:hypothetical protein